MSMDMSEIDAMFAPSSSNIPTTSAPPQNNAAVKDERAERAWKKLKEKTVVGECPHCKIMWDFPVNPRGQISAIPQHNIPGSEDVCPGSGEKPSVVLASFLGEFGATDLAMAYRELERLKGEPFSSSSDFSRALIAAGGLPTTITCQTCRTSVLCGPHDDRDLMPLHTQNGSPIGPNSMICPGSGKPALKTDPTERLPAPMMPKQTSSEAIKAEMNSMKKTR